MGINWGEYRISPRGGGCGKTATSTGVSANLIFGQIFLKTATRPKFYYVDPTLINLTWIFKITNHQK